MLFGVVCLFVVVWSASCACLLVVRVCVLSVCWSLVVVWWLLVDGCVLF